MQLECFTLRTDDLCSGASDRRHHNFQLVLFHNCELPTQLECHGDCLAIGFRNGIPVQCSGH